MPDLISNDTLNRLNQSCFSTLDRQFAALLCNHQADLQAVYLAAALVSRCRRDGHVCLDFQQLDRLPWIGEIAHLTSSTAMTWPPLPTWIEALRSHPTMIGKPGERQPLILDDRNRLYLYRYWRMEQNLADKLRSFHPFPNASLPSAATITRWLDEFFPFSSAGDQAPRLAALAAIHLPISIISGGPGTGKTTTIAKILAFFYCLFAPRKWRVGVTALTGKAAHRLQTAIGAFCQSLPKSVDLNADHFPHAGTLHKLLGYHPQHLQFRFHQDNPLPYDLVIVDEASMIDLSLMDKLLAALPSGARLILVGDKDQLASVEPGAVFADLCQSFPRLSLNQLSSTNLINDIPQPVSNPTSGLALDQNQFPNLTHGYGLTLLTKSYRFSSSGDIHRLSQWVLAGDEDNAWKLVAAAHNNPEGEIDYQPLPGPAAVDLLILSLLLELTAYLKATDSDEIFRLFNQRKILTPFRIGPFGTLALNATIERLLQDQQVISTRGKFYHGRPLIITKNDARTQLFNGDIGMILREPEDNQLYACFPQGERPYRRFLPARLPEHETGFALTINKAQGSEYPDIHLLVPEADHQLLTRELLYTGITRASRRLAIYTTEAAFKQTIRNRTLRFSGLKDRMTEGKSLTSREITTCEEP